jgi:hypothetical protein
MSLFLSPKAVINNLFSQSKKLLIMSFLQMKFKASVALSIFIVLLMFTSILTNAQCTSFSGATGTDNVGSQPFTGRLGMRFTVNSPIIVSQLGAFDSGQDGFNSTISVAIVDASGSVVVPASGTPLSLIGVIGTYVGPFQMVGGFPSVTLAPGNYTVVAYGYGPTEMNGNSNLGDALAITNDGGGLITHVDSPWDGTAAMGVPTGTHVIGGFHAGNFSFTGVAPTLTATLNGVTVVSNNNGIDDTGTFLVCNSTSPNISIDAFTDGTGQNNIYVQQVITTSNATLTPWCSNCDEAISLFAGATATASLIDPTSPGFVTVRFRAYVDADGSDDYTVGECAGDWIEYTININALPTVVLTDLLTYCVGATLLHSATVTPSTPNFGSYTYQWSACASNDCTDCNTNGFIPNNSAISPNRQWNTASPDRSVTLTILTPGCDNVSDCEAFEIVADPVSPTLNIASPVNGTGVCVGNSVSATFNSGTAGTGTCTDEFRFSTDNGSSWAVYVPGSNIVMGNNTTIIQGRRVCDGIGCDLPVQSFATLATWTSNPLPTANITPDPAEVCILTDLPLNGGAAAGTRPYGFLWTGSGAQFLDDEEINFPTFNHNVIGMYNLVFTVTDANGCVASDAITVNVRDVGLPEIACPTLPVTMASDPDRCTSVVCFGVSAMDMCPVNLPNTLAGHTFIGTYNGHTYFRSNSTFSWEAANQAAVASGGHLVSVNNVAEKNWLLANAPAGTYWMGLRYSPSLEQFKWTSGEPVVYTNWGFGQPGIIEGDYVYSWEFGNTDIGWFDSPSILNRRYIVEFQGFPVTLVSGLPSGSNFPVGSTTVTYRATDSAGNTDECTFEVIVSDVQAPEITCPSNITVQLEPLQCEGIATFAPTISDNCPDVFFNYLTEIESGDPFPIGINTVTLLAEDAAGNTAECSFTVTVLDYINPSLGCKPVNFSLDGDCSGSLTPTEVLTGWEGPMGEILLGCLDSFSISITGPNGQNIGNLLTGEYLGKTLDYSITNVNGFTCWNTLLVEDKIAPTIRCRDIAVNCLTDLSKVVVAFPEDNCNARLVLVNEFHALLDCDPDFIGTVTRTYKAVDDYGNESAPCTATIYLRRSTNMGIVPPPANRKLSCSGSYLRDDRGLGYPHPTVTGIPTFEGRALWPQSQLDMQYCNAGIDYKDDILVDTDCKKRIRRTWTVTEWWCSTSVELFLGVQMIDIVDEIAPVIPQVQNYTITTQSRSCTASVTLPTLNITDNCNEVYKVYVNANDGNPTGFVNGNGGILELGVGVHTITYTAFDNCTNSSSMQYRVTVQDNTDPVAVCDQFATVSIKSNGYTEVTAQAVDDGSYDECGEVTLKIRRMEDPCEFGADTAWFDKVGFCCLDANTTRMVQLLVTDKGGNTNICMVSVNVQEKVNPTISCPSDTLIRDCSFTFDPSLSGANNAFGSAVINDNCPANNTLDHVLVDNRNQCGIGTVVRTFSVRQGTTVYQTCTQTITFENDKPFYINRLDPEDPTDDVVWPGVYTAVGQCSPIGLDPAITGRPTFTEDACDLVGMRHEDAVYPFTTNGACYKIIRTWTIIDWCQKDQDGNHLTWTYEQEIKVMDNDAPVITVPSSPVVFETLSCYSDEITLGATAVDCTPASELRWNYIITQGAIEVGSGTTNIVVDSFEVGAYTISFTVEDRCGNQTTASYNFIVETTKAPTAICKKGLAAPLVLMNVGNGSQLMAMIPVEFFDNKSYHTCKYSFELSYTSDVNNDTITFTTPGCKPIQMWVTDQNGNTSYCETFVDVQLNGVDNNCQGSTLLSTVSGRTVKENNEEIEAVTVELLGSEQDPVNTNESGTYVFSPMTHGGTYHIVPFKDGDDMNGVSTLDVVMIQRHILGIEKLKTPYQVIAADANKSESVTAADLTEIRKLILGNIPSFPNNTSWRFVDAGYKFPDATDPWIGTIAERYFVDKLNSNMDVNFIGIKTGDVNGSAKGHNVNDETEARTSTRLIIGDQKVMSGEIIEIPVLADENSIVYGLQAQLIANGLVIRDIREKSIKVEDDNFAIRSSNMANLSISIPNGTRVYKDKVLFVIEAEVLHGGQLSDMIKLGNEMSAEIYTNDLSAQSIAIGWRTDHLSAFALSNVTPNPWNTQTQISFDLPADGMVSFKVKDYTGKKVISIVDQYTAGQNTIQINRSDLGQSGVYVYELRYEDKVITGKMILIE